MIGLNTKELFKNALDEDIFKDNPFDTTVKERTIRKINRLENRRTSNKRFQLIFNRLLTVSVCAVLIIITINMINNNNLFNKNGKEGSQTANEGQKENSLTTNEKNMLTNKDALEEYKGLPENIRNIFTENLLHYYNKDSDFREKVAIALTMTDYLSVYKLEAMTDKVPGPNFNWGFTYTNEKVYVIGEDWIEIENNFINLNDNSTSRLKEHLNQIGKEYVINTGELDFPEGTDIFKPKLSHNNLDQSIISNIVKDVEKKIVGLNEISGSMGERDNLIYTKINDFLSSYQDIQGIDNQQELDTYFQVSRDFYIFSLIILRPVEVEVLKEPKYLSNEEQVKDIVENYPR